MGPLEHARRLERCVFVGSRLEVPNGLHADLVRDTGPDSVTKLLSGYADVDRELSESGEPILPDVFRWLKARWRVWVQGVQSEREKQAFLEGDF